MAAELQSPMQTGRRRLEEAVAQRPMMPGHMPNWGTC